MKRNRIILITTGAILIAGGIIFLTGNKTGNKNIPAAGHYTSASKNRDWTAPDSSSIPHTAEGDLIRYGRKLIVNTSYYFGPKGIISHLANGMNCQNCHLEA
ncbi:MAG TPA: cytochrome C, partial [Puia sp.]